MKLYMLSHSAAANLSGCPVKNFHFCSLFLLLWQYKCKLWVGYGEIVFLSLKKKKTSKMQTAALPLWFKCIFVTFLIYELYCVTYQKCVYYWGDIIGFMAHYMQISSLYCTVRFAVHTLFCVLKKTPKAVCDSSKRINVWHTSMTPTCTSYLQHCAQIESRRRTVCTVWNLVSNSYK